MIQRERTSALRDRGPEIAPLLGVVPPSAMTRDDGHHSLPAGVDDESCLELPLASSPGVILKIEKGRASGHTRVLHEPAAAMQPCSVCDCSSYDLPEVSYHWICQHYVGCAGIGFNGWLRTCQQYPLDDVLDIGRRKEVCALHADRQGLRAVARATRRAATPMTGSPSPEVTGDSASSTADSTTDDDQAEVASATAR